MNVTCNDSAALVSHRHGIFSSASICFAVLYSCRSLSVLSENRLTVIVVPPFQDTTAVDVPVPGSHQAREIRRLGKLMLPPRFAKAMYCSSPGRLAANTLRNVFTAILASEREGIGVSTSTK